MIEELIDSAVIVLHLSTAEKAAALDEVLEAMVAGDGLGEEHRPEVQRLLTEREKLGSTGIGNGIAVPHVKFDQVAAVRLAVARSPEGIDYQAIDGKPVHTMFLILAPSESSAAHLEALKWVSGLARNADFRRFVMSATGDDEIRDLLREMSQGG